MGTKAQVAVGALTLLLGAGGAAVGVMATRTDPVASGRPAVVRDDEGAQALSSTGSETRAAAAPTDPAAWRDPFQHLVLATPGTPTLADPVGRSDPAADAALVARVRATPGVVDAQLVGPGTLAVTATGVGADALAAVTGVVGVADDVPLAVTGTTAGGADPMEPAQWHLENRGEPDQTGGYLTRARADAGLARAHAASTGAGVLVAVIDTGVDLDHPDLAGRLWRNPDERCGDGVDDDGNGYVDDCDGWDLGDLDADPRPDAGAPDAAHGTLVAGLVAAGRNGVGGVGAAPDATVMAIKVSSGTGSVASAGVGAAVRYAVDEGAQVIVVSMATNPGTARPTVEPLEAALAYAGARGVLVVAAAGNDAVDLGDGDVYPAGFARWYDHVVAVGATSAVDGRAAFSNLGLPAPQQLYAPGVALLSTVPGGRWARMSGTSAAAPLVAGSAALVIASGRATAPAAVRDLLGATATVLPFGARLDAAAALGLPPAPPGETVIPTGATPPPPSAPPTSASTTPPPTEPATLAPATAPSAAPTTARAPAPTTPAPTTPVSTSRTPATAPRRAATTTTSTTAAPPATTAPLRPVAVGVWRLDGLSQRTGPLAGGTEVVASGAFPTSVPVTVWFSRLGPSVPAVVAADGASLTFLTPAFSVRTVTEVTVRFTIDGRRVALTLRDAFTFDDTAG